MMSGFVGEFLVLSSTFGSVSRSWATLATLGVILGAAYMLWLVQRIFYGPESQMVAGPRPDDLRVGEMAVLCPLVVLMLVMGLAPSIWFKAIEHGISPAHYQVVSAISPAPAPVDPAIQPEVRR
jgi:NADH-quinone oxidoreductase subunit M